MLWHASFHWPHLAQAGPSMAATALILHAATRAPIAPMGQQPPWEEATSSTGPQAGSSGLFNTWVGLSGLPRSGAPRGPAGQHGASHSSSSIVCHRVGTLALSTTALTRAQACSCGLFCSWVEFSFSSSSSSSSSVLWCGEPGGTDPPPCTWDKQDNLHTWLQTTGGE